MKRRKTSGTPKIQGTLSPDPNANVESQVSVLEDVIDIKPNVCIQKNMCQHCGRGDRYGIPLHFLLHYPDGDFRTVCYTCGKKAASITGLKLPSTEADIEVQESKADLRLISIARRNMDVNNGDI